MPSQNRPNTVFARIAANLAGLLLIALSCSTNKTGSGVQSPRGTGGGGGDAGAEAGSAGKAIETGGTPFVLVDGGGMEQAGAAGTLDEIAPTDPGTSPTVGAGLPADIVDQFGKATAVSDSLSPTLVYPTAETMFPPDIKHLLFQWKAPAGSAFRLHFGFAARPFDVFTNGSHSTCLGAGLGAKCWESLDDLAAHFLYEPGSTFTVQVSALDPTDSGKAHQSPTYSFHVGPESALGAIYYWSTTLKGVRRGALEDGQAADYLTPTTGLSAAQASALTLDQLTARCVACHTVSRGGKRLSVSLPGDQLGLANISPDSPPPFTYASASSGAWGNKDPVVGASWVTFSPDENHIVSATNGVLTVRDISVDGKAPPVGNGGISLPAPNGIQFYGSMPDWAPDGRHVVFTATPANLKSATNARHIRGSSLAWMTATAGNPYAFESFQILAQSRGQLPGSSCQALDTPGSVSSLGSGMESYANPMFSPDSQWLLYSRADCETERDASAEVVLSAASPGAMPNHLLRANTTVGDRTVTGITNGMPTWGPRISSTGPHIAWLAFTSTRDFGLVLAPGTQLLHNISYPARQLWIAAIDLDKAATSEDPSYPAFRLPAQDYDENNHRPFWVHDELKHFTHVDPVPPK